MRGMYACTSRMFEDTFTLVAASMFSHGNKEINKFIALCTEYRNGDPSPQSRAVDRSKTVLQLQVPFDNGSTLKEKRSLKFSFRVDSFSEGRQNDLDRVASPESVSVLLNGGLTRRK